MAGAQCKLVCNCDHDRQNVCEGLNLSRRSGADSRGSQDRARANEWQSLLVAMRLGATPVPIPNTMVKTQTAEGTALETVWESRWPPNLKEKDRGRSAAEVKINTGKDEQQLINANPISRAVLLKSWVSPVIRDLKRFRFLMTDERVSQSRCEALRPPVLSLMALRANASKINTV